LPRPTQKPDLHPPPFLAIRHWHSRAESRQQPACLQSYNLTRLQFATPGSFYGDAAMSLGWKSAGTQMKAGERTMIGWRMESRLWGGAPECWRSRGGLILSGYTVRSITFCMVLYSTKFAGNIERSLPVSEVESATQASELFPAFRRDLAGRCEREA